MKISIMLVVAAAIRNAQATNKVATAANQFPRQLNPTRGKVKSSLPFDPQDLIAGGGNVASAINVGRVAIDGTDVTYHIDAVGWCLLETHLQVASEITGIPQTKTKNPIPGKFQYSAEHECVTKYTYEDVDVSCNDYVAAHAVVAVAMADLVSLEDNLPELVTFALQLEPRDLAYFQLTIGGDGSLAGTYLTWCVDTDLQIFRNTTYEANVYSSYGDVATLIDLVEYPDNFDKVNYIINQDYVGKLSGCGGQTYTYGDVQRAIWTLIDDGVSDPRGSWLQCRVDEILEDANQYGVDFVPKCGESVAVIFVPTGPNQRLIAQVVVGEVDVAPCVPEDDTETAWGFGEDFEGNNWATYFTYACPTRVRHLRAPHVE